MKALTICQPYAEMILLGEKRVENRTWSTRFRGRFAIHAGKSREWMDPDDERPYVFGAVVAFATLLAVEHVDDIEAGGLDLRFPWLREHSHCHGPFCWVLGDVQRITQPVPMKGAQGLWTIPDGRPCA